MTILVTGASGHLGRLIVERLLARGAAASDIVAGARTVAKAKDLADRGVRVVALDYDIPETIAAALEGVDRVMLVSGSEVGKRAPQHQAVIDAVAAHGVEQFVYTSIYRADTSVLSLAEEHVITEAAIAKAGLPAVILRNNWYTENYADDLAHAADSGKIFAAAGEGRVASATREDLADAAAVVLLGEVGPGRVLELSGDASWSYDDLAAAAAEVLGRSVEYVSQTVEERTAALESVGLDAGTAGFVAGLDDAIAQGALDASDHTLSELIGRPTTSLVEGLRQAR